MDARCKKIRATCTEYLRGALDPADTSRLRDHLGTCAGCREFMGARGFAVFLNTAFATHDIEPDERFFCGLNKKIAATAVKTRQPDAAELLVKKTWRLIPAAAMLVLLLTASFSFIFENELTTDELSPIEDTLLFEEQLPHDTHVFNAIIAEEANHGG